MTHSPRRRVEPLPPPPGSFDAVLGRARARRYRRLTAVSGVAGVFLAGIVGGLAMGGGAAVDNIVSLATRGQVASVSPSPTAPQTKLASGVPTTTSPHKTRPARSTPAASSPAPPPVVVDRPELVRGRAVTAGGDPVAGLYVYTGSLSGGGFVPAAEPSTLTGAQGRFAVPCGPVLLTSWPLNTRLDVTSGGRWEATVVPAPLCSRDAAPQETVMRAGTTVQGRVTTDVGCADTEFGLTLWLNGQPSAAVRLSGLHEGDVYRFSGVPAGTHVLRNRSLQESVAVVRGDDTVTHAVTFSCPGVPTPTSTPSPTTPTPGSTPSETTTTPVPSPTTTTTPTG